MQIVPVIVGPFEVNCYLVFDRHGALVVDPGADAAKIRSALEQRGATPLGYLLTHGHADHVGALHDLRAWWPAPYYMHPQDARWAFTEVNQIPDFYPPPLPPGDEPVALADGLRLAIGPFSIEVIATPGHTPGGVSFYFPAERILFSGDTLFEGSVGRTDLPGGDAHRLSRSLARLRELPPDTVVYPGHGPRTTLADEMEHNFFLREAR